MRRENTHKKSALFPTKNGILLVKIWLICNFKKKYNFKIYVNLVLIISNQQEDKNLGLSNEDLVLGFEQTKLFVSVGFVQSSLFLFFFVALRLFFVCFYVKQSIKRIYLCLLCLFSVNKPIKFKDLISLQWVMWRMGKLV